MKDEKKQKKEVLKKEMERLGSLQRECKEEKIPVYLLFDGYDGAGKGVQIGRLMQALDPRGFDVYTGDKDTEEEALRSFLWRFAVHAPAAGRIAIYDTSWYRRVQADRFEGILKEKQVDAAFEDILAFERCFVDGGTVIVKLFLEISEKEQAKRFEKLLGSKDTAWRVTEKERERNAHYGKYKKISDEMIRRTDMPYAPWYVIDVKDKTETALTVIKTVADVLEKALEKKRREKSRNFLKLRSRRTGMKKGFLRKRILRRASRRQSTGKNWKSSRNAWRRSTGSSIVCGSR